MHTFCHKMTHSVSFFTGKSGQAIKASVSLRRRGRIVLVHESKIHIYSEIRCIKERWICQVSYLRSRLSWHASGTIGSRTTLRKYKALHNDTVRFKQSVCYIWLNHQFLSCITLTLLPGFPVGPGDPRGPRGP